MADEGINGKPNTARSYRTSLIDDNAVISLNLKWFGQIIVLIGALVYGYWRIESRITELEQRMGSADDQISDLISRHIADEQSRYAEMEKEIEWYQKELNLNPFSWKKKKRK
tara:strand:- start:630 stop:965 length:336 start_codon:yes stop_codon:yes gene_type:complete